MNYPFNEEAYSAERILQRTKEKIAADLQKSRIAHRSVPKKWWIPAAAALMSVILTFSAVGVVYNRIHSPQEVFSRAVPDYIAEQNMDYLQVYDFDPVYSGGYRIELLGSLNADKDGMNIRYTYLLCAVSKEDGSPMTVDEISDFCMSPFIEGMNPQTEYNIFNAGSGMSMFFVEDGIGYRVLQTNNINLTAKGKDLYVGVYKGLAPDMYGMDKKGRIHILEEMAATAALFRLK